MPSLLEKFWGFYLNEHAEDIDPKGLKSMDELLDAELALVNTLNDEQKALYMDYQNKTVDHQSVMELIAFRRGVQLGVQFMTEAYGKKE